MWLIVLRFGVSWFELSKTNSDKRRADGRLKQSYSLNWFRLDQHDDLVAESCHKTYKHAPMSRGTSLISFFTSSVLQVTGEFGIVLPFLSEPLCERVGI